MSNGQDTASNEATLSLKAATTITEHPMPQSVATGGTAVFTATATGEGAVAYRWQKDGSDLSDGEHYSGTGTTMLTISNADAADAGSYRCRATADCGDAVSSEAALTVNPPPTVPADFNQDGAVDMTDFAYFQMCFNGPNQSPAQSGCELADLDSDGDADMADFAVFQTCFNGPNRPPACQYGRGSL